MEAPTQTALVLAAQAGDQKAFEALVSTYRRELLVHCYRMLGSFQDAEDLVQETLLCAWEKRTTLTSPGSYRAWLYRIATNLCLDKLRSAPRRSLPPDTHPVTGPTHPLPDVTLWEQADISGFVALLREDAWLAMPPFPVWFQGRAAIATWFATRIFTPDRQRHLLPTRANGSPAFGLYLREAGSDVYQLFGLVVLGMEGEQITSLVGFLDLSSLSSFALPPTFPDVLGEG
jgi:RNA polymerase sigma factor (sigma-70 family)